MFLLDPTTPGAPADLVFSASDLVAASECEYRTLRILDEKLGRSPKADFPADEMQARAGKLGDLHEHKVLAALIDRARPWDAARGHRGLLRGTRNPGPGRPGGQGAETAAALHAGADVVFQATFFDGEFLGYADFLVGGSPAAAWTGWTCLAGARCTAVRGLGHQAGAARQGRGPAAARRVRRPADQARAGPAPRVTLVLGNLERSSHSLADLLPVYRERRARFRELTAAHRARGGPRDVAAARRQLLRQVRLLRRAGGRAPGPADGGRHDLRPAEEACRGRHHHHRRPRRPAAAPGHRFAAAPARPGQDADRAVRQPTAHAPS